MFTLGEKSEFKFDFSFLSPLKPELFVFGNFAIPTSSSSSSAANRSVGLLFHFSSLSLPGMKMILFFLFADGQLYAATFSDSFGGEPLIHREKIRTERSDLNQLNGKYRLLSVRPCYDSSFDARHSLFCVHVI